MATVVANHFGIATPNRAYFGQKDAAQVAVLRLAAQGTADTGLLFSAAEEVLKGEPAFRPDYLALVDPDTLLPVPALSREYPTLLAVAGWIGATRLIDNVLLRKV